MEEGGCECPCSSSGGVLVIPFQRGTRELAFFRFIFHLKCSSFRARTRPNLHSTLQFSSPTPCDSSPLHDSPRANSLTIRSSHFASEDPPRSRSHSNNLPAPPDRRPSVFLKRS